MALSWCAVVSTRVENCSCTVGDDFLTPTDAKTRTRVLTGIQRTVGATRVYSEPARRDGRVRSDGFWCSRALKAARVWRTVRTAAGTESAYKMTGLESCHTIEELVAVSFEHQCGPAARLTGELTKGPGLSLPHAGKLLANGMKGDYLAIVRWLKYMYANSWLLMDVCARGAAAPTFETLSHALFSANADVVLWGARLLTRLATELSELHPQPLMDWLDTQGLAALVSAWRTHPDLHAIGALLPLVPPCVGTEELVFFTSTMPAVLGMHMPHTSTDLETLGAVGRASCASPT